MAFSENKHKVCPIEYNLLFGVDVGVIVFNGFSSISRRLLSFYVGFQRCIIACG